MISVRASGRGWAYLGVALGGAVSIAANVAHSYVPPANAAAGWHPHVGAVGFAVVWPVFLFVAIEILARTNWKLGVRWVLLRFGGLLPVASVAAVVSYRHLSGLLAFYGEDPLTVAIGPLAVDGLMVMATGALIATGTRRVVAMATTTVVAKEAGAPADTPGEAAAAETPAIDLPEPPISETTPDTDTTPDTAPDAGTAVAPDTRRTSKRTPARTRRAGKPDTATAVARLRDRHPDLSAADIARRLGVTDRTVRRHLSTTPEPPATPLAA